VTPGPRWYPFLQQHEPLLPSPSPPGHPPYNSAASPPVPVHSSAKGMTVSSADDNKMGLQQLANVLTSLRYNEMAAAVTLLADSQSITRRTGFSHYWGTT
jgi:hypothetical protein